VSLYPAALYPSAVRRALDYLLDAYPMFDLVSVDWQRPSSGEWQPWVLVLLGQRSEEFEPMESFALWHFAIFKTTGALHTMEPPRGPVSDDPIWTP
jgi:hypothetical protein